MILNLYLKDQHSLQIALPVDALCPDLDGALLKNAGGCDILVYNGEQTITT